LTAFIPTPWEVFEHAGRFYVARRDEKAAQYLWPIGATCFTLKELLDTTEGAGSWSTYDRAALAAEVANQIRAVVLELQKEEARRDTNWGEE
jgi:hypothetical protein